MGDLFKALSAGLGRFVNAWLMPSVVSCGLILLIFVPTWRGPNAASKAGESVNLLDKASPLLQGAAFLLISFTLAVILAYCSRPLYQFLEGYTMPRWLQRPMRRRMYRAYLRLRITSRSGSAAQRAFAREQLKLFPEDAADLMPTRLGNALKAVETYGHHRLGLDSQTLWFEVQAVSAPELKKDADEAQGSTDFFISAIIFLTLLTTTGIATSLRAFLSIREVLTDPKPVTWFQVATPMCVAVVAGSCIYPAYRQAVNKVAEWRWSLQALLNLCRPALASALNLELPPTYQEEKRLWSDFSNFVYYGADRANVQTLNRWRANRKRSAQPAITAPPLRERKRWDRLP